METLKAILVDDELNSLENLRHKLTEFCPDVTVIATTQKPGEAIALIKEHKPDVLFLDVEMPRMNGFTLLDEIGDIDFDIIFTTAYNHYAVDAIRISALDYLMKPIAIKDLQNAVQRLLRKQKNQTEARVDTLKQALSPQKGQGDKIAIPTAGGLEFIIINAIVHIESSGNYSKIYLTDGKSFLVTKLIGDFETLLAPYKFLRVHHSHLINMAHVKRYIRGDGGQVVMMNDEVIDISRRKKDEFLKIISQ